MKFDKEKLNKWKRCPCSKCTIPRPNVMRFEHKNQVGGEVTPHFYVPGEIQPEYIEVVW